MLSGIPNSAETSPFLVDPNSTHQHWISVTEGADHTADAFNKVFATCVIHAASDQSKSNRTAFPLTILANGTKGTIASSLGTLFSNQQKIVGSFSSACVSCWVAQGGGVRMWKLRSILDGFIPRENFIPNFFSVRCSHHGTDTLHQITIDMGHLAVNDHIGVPVTRFSYVDTNTGELACTLLLSEWEDLDLFSQAFGKCDHQRPTEAPCILEALRQTPIVGRITGTSDGVELFGWDDVSAALREYAGVGSGMGNVSICSEDHVCFPTACATPMSTLRAAKGEWVDVTVGLK
jgi:hypothetical protein